jgi:hypothetical protein
VSNVENYPVFSNIAVAIFRISNGWVFWQPYVEQAGGGELDLMVLFGQVEEWAAIQY